MGLLQRWYCCSRHACPLGREDVGEDDVVSGEAFFDCGWGRQDNHQAGTKSERVNLAVFLRKVVESTVWGFLRRWRCPIIGRERGLGGRCLVLVRR
ncbi:hypothetical protein SLA2020_414860 [Shorea laevis]